MAKAKVKIIKAIRDDASAKEAMKVVGKPLKDINSLMDKAASETAEGKAQRNMCALMFAWGLSIKSTGKTTFDDKLYGERFDAYKALHWPKGTPQPSDGTENGYRSQFKAFAEAAWSKFDAREAVQENLAIANVQLPWRAARMRDVIKLEDKPSKDKLAEVFKITAAAGTLKVRKGNSVFLSIVNTLVDAAKNKELIKFLAENAAQYEWLPIALKAATDYRAAEAAKLKDGSKKQKGYRDSVRMAREAMLAFKNTRGRTTAQVGHA